MTNLTIWDNARQAIEEAHAIDEVKDIRDQAEAFRLYRKQQKESLEAQNQVAEIKLRCERRIGEMLKEMPKQHGARPADTDSHDVTPPTLKELGIGRMDSSRWQAIAELPQDKFEEHIATVQAKNEELTTVGVVELAKSFTYKETQYERLKDSPQEIADGIIKGINNHLQQASNLMRDVPFQDATPTLIRMLFENNNDFLTTLSAFQKTIETLLSGNDATKLNYANDIPLGKTDPDSAVSVAKFQAKLHQTIKETPKINAIINRITNLRFTLERMPLSKMTDETQQGWVRNEISELQEILNNYVVKDITPIGNNIPKEIKQQKDESQITEGEIIED